MLGKVLTAAAVLMVAAAPLAAQEGQATWDGLTKVDSKKFEEVYLLPLADFRGYTKVMIDPTEVSFRKNWQRDQNADASDLSTQVTNSDARRILNDAQTSFDKLFAEAYTKDGYQVVAAAGPDVLRISTAIVNLDVTAPDTMSAGLDRTYSNDPGHATLVLEARDSVTNQLLGRALDERDTSDMGLTIRNSVTNAAAFEAVFQQWARSSADGLAELKSLSPINPAALQTRR